MGMRGFLGRRIRRPRPARSIIGRHHVVFQADRSVPARAFPGLALARETADFAMVAQAEHLLAHVECAR